MVSRLTGAFVRAMLTMVLIATPSLLLSGVGTDARQIAALIALFLAALVFVEYASVYPGLVEFRHAPPFNRIRFLSIFATVFLLSAIMRGQTDPTTMTQLLGAIGALLAQTMDMPFSPVRLITLMLPPDSEPDHVALVRTAAGISYLISLLSLALFVLILRFGGWPHRGAVFNVWVNLPTFDPTVGGDVVRRLDRDARINVALGVLLPFLIPAMVKAAATSFGQVDLTDPQVMIWTMAAWAFLPASLFMRGIAMWRIADMIREKRRQAENGTDPEFVPA